MAPAEPEGTAAGWHQAGTGPAALPPCCQLCSSAPGLPPAPPQRRAADRLIFDLERRAMPASSAMFPRRCNPGGKCQHGAWGAAEAAGASSRSQFQGCHPLPCINTLLIPGSSTLLTLQM